MQKKYNRLSTKIDRNENNEQVSVLDENPDVNYNARELALHILSLDDAMRKNAVFYNDKKVKDIIYAAYNALNSGYSLQLESMFRGGRKSRSLRKRRPVRRSIRDMSLRRQSSRRNRTNRRRRSN